MTQPDRLDEPRRNSSPIVTAWVTLVWGVFGAGLGGIAGALGTILAASDISWLWVVILVFMAAGAYLFFADHYMLRGALGIPTQMLLNGCAIVFASLCFFLRIGEVGSTLGGAIIGAVLLALFHSLLE